MADRPQSTLLPCPFCGGAAAFEARKPGGTGASGMEPYEHRIACTNAACGVRPASKWRSEAEYDWQARTYVAVPVREQTADAWNRRVLPQ